MLLAGENWGRLIENLTLFTVIDIAAWNCNFAALSSAIARWNLNNGVCRRPFIVVHKIQLIITKLSASVKAKMEGFWQSTLVTLSSDVMEKSA
jgi:hypothetical protein